MGPAPADIQGMARCHHRRGRCALLNQTAVVLSASLAAHAQENQPSEADRPRAAQLVNRPFAARRVVFQFDFEPDPREVFELPRYWGLAQDGSPMSGARPGFPTWNTATFDNAAAYSGSRSVRLSTKGGSVCLRLEPGVIPVFPGTDYLISGHVQTRGLTYARAAISARYLDKTNKPIPGAETRSDLITTQPGEWKVVVAPLSRDFPTAAYIQIDLELLQPEQIGKTDLGAHQLWPQDYHGDSWFDQVAVVQLPQATIATASPLNIIRAPERPRVKISLRDLTGEQIAGIFTLQNAAGITVDSIERPTGGGSGSWDWDPKVAAYGWYRATLDLRSNQRRVGTTYVDFAWLPPAPGRDANLHSGDASRFGVQLSEMPAGQRSTLIDMLDLLGAGAVTIPIWTAETTPASADWACTDLVRVMEKLRATDRRITLSLPRIPDALASQLRLDPTEPLALFKSDEKVWSGYLMPFLDKYGQSVQRWHVGGAIAGPKTQAPSQEAVASLTRLLGRLVPGPVVELPWPADQTPPRLTGTVEFLTTLPHEIPAEGLAELSAELKSASGSGPMSFILDALPQPEFSRLDSCINLVKCATELWAARGDSDGGAPPAPPTLTLLQPWDGPSGTRTAPMPHAEFAAWANLVDRLQNRRPAGRLVSAAGVTCIILSSGPTAPGSRTGSLVLWRHTAPADIAAGGASWIDLYLGEEAVDLVDIFGNRTSQAPSVLGASANKGPVIGGARGARSPLAHHLPVTDSPIFVEGVDVDLARFAASFHLDPPFAPSSAQEHEIAMVLTNPWKERIEGRISVLEPGGLSADPGLRDRSWRITPRTSTFSIGAGETGRIPLLLAFSPVEEAGLKDFLVEIELSGTRDYAPLRLHTNLEIGVTDFQMEVVYQLAGPDLKVTVQVTNRGKSATSYDINGFAEGYPRARANVSDLSAGAVTSRILSFPGGADKLKNQKITVSIQDISTQSRATRSITVE
jgi:hypothetical protein